MNARNLPTVTSNLSSEYALTLAVDVDGSRLVPSVKVCVGTDARAQQLSFWHWVEAARHEGDDSTLASGRLTLSAQAPNKASPGK